MNAHDALTDAVLQALRFPAPVTDGRIEENLDLGTIDESETEAIAVQLDNSEPLQGYTGSPIDWLTTVTIECFARSDSRTPVAGRASRALHARVYERLLADVNLGRVWMMGIDAPSLSFDNAFNGSDRAGVTTARYGIRHRTAGHTLEV